MPCLDTDAAKSARKKEEKLGRVFAGEGDVMEEHERDKVEQNALQVQNVLNALAPARVLWAETAFTRVGLVLFQKENWPDNGKPQQPDGF